MTKDIPKEYEFGLLEIAAGIKLLAGHAGGLHDPRRAEQMVGLGVSMIWLGCGALATPDFPERLRLRQSLADFDPAMLRPTATLANEERWRHDGSAPS